MCSVCLYIMLEKNSLCNPFFGKFPLPGSKAYGSMAVSPINKKTLHLAVQGKNRI